MSAEAQSKFTDREWNEAHFVDMQATSMLLGMRFAGDDRVPDSIKLPAQSGMTAPFVFEGNEMEALIAFAVRWQIDELTDEEKQQARGC